MLTQWNSVLVMNLMFKPVRTSLIFQIRRMENWGLRRKHFVQKQEIFIANKISVVVKDEEMAELLKRSHPTTTIFNL